MRWASPRNLIILGILMMLAGVILPFLMVTKVLESTFFLNFFSYISSVIGMLIGIIGVATYSRTSRH
jgi:hypothetical protein